MIGVAGITDDVIRAAGGGSKDDLARVAQAVQPQVCLMIAARLSPSPCQLDAVEDLAQEVLTALMTAITNLDNPTAEGLSALRKKLGRAGMIRFLQQFETGSGDYAAERHKWTDRVSMSDLRALAGRIRKRRPRTTH